MFGTLRYNSDTKDVEHVELERADGFEARGYSRTACNECRARKVNTSSHLLTLNADQAYITQLKCSGDKNGCQRCHAISITCVYQSNSDKSTDRSGRQSTRSFTHSTSISSPNNSLEIEQTTRPQSRQRPADQTQFTGTPDTDIVGGGPQIQTPSATPVTPLDLSWALSPLPEASDLDWEFPNGDFQHMMDVGQIPSTGDNVPRTPAFRSCAPLTHKSLPQSLDVDMEADNDTADVSYSLDSSHPRGQYLHQLDQSSASSSSMAVSRMHNASHPPLAMSKQGNKSLPREVHLHQTEGAQRGSQPWDSVINLASIMNPPVTPGGHSWPASGLSHLHAPRMHSSSANVLVAPNMTPVSSTSGHPSFSRSTSARPSEPARSSDARSMCQCVTTMLKMLESMGVQGLSTDALHTGAGLDVILSSLASGMNMIDQVLACGQCNASAENGMLLATIAQQLGATVASVTTCLPSQEYPYESYECTHWRQNRVFSTQRPQSLSVRNGSIFDSSNNDDPARSTSAIHEGAIFFGRYKIDSPKIRLQLVYHALLLHISQLQEILVHIKDRVGSNRGAQKLLANTELEVRRLWDIFHSKVLHQ